MFHFAPSQRARATMPQGAALVSAAKLAQNAAMSSPALLTAILYDDGAAIEPVLALLVRELRDGGYRLAGFLQHDRARPDRRRCDMSLENLANGALLAISEDRGAAARGCRLDYDAMAGASAAGLAALRAGADVLILNKFGKTEAAGAGFRTLLAEALVADTPIVIGVPHNNLEAWRAFAQGLGAEFACAALAGAGVAQKLGFQKRG